MVQFVAVGMLLYILGLACATMLGQGGAYLAGTPRLIQRLLREIVRQTLRLFGFCLRELWQWGTAGIEWLAMWTADRLRRW